MHALTLHEQQAKLQTFTPGTENHGKDPVPRSTLRIAATIPAAKLAMLHPALPGSLYVTEEEDTNKPRLFEALPTDALTKLIYLHLSRIIWRYKGVGCDVTIQWGIGESNIVLKGSNIDGMEIEPMEGGSVVLWFNVKCHPQEGDVDKIYRLQKSDITITVESPAQAELVEDDDDGEKKPRGRKAA